MDDIKMELSVPLDDDGYFVFQCPNCEERFKLLPREFEADDVSEIYCPYCGLQSAVNDCYPPEVVERAMIAAQNAAMGLIQEMLKGLGKSSKGIIQVDAKLEEEPDLTSLPEMDHELEVVKFKCCDRAAKVHPASSRTILFCPYDGVN